MGRLCLLFPSPVCGCVGLWRQRRRGGGIVGGEGEGADFFWGGGVENCVCSPQPPPPTDSVGGADVTAEGEGPGCGSCRHKDVEIAELRKGLRRAEAECASASGTPHDTVRRSPKPYLTALLQ